jgi:hypothetical protein
MTVFLASLPLALFGGESISGFAWVMLFGIVVGTSSSIGIAAPILLFLGEHRLRRDAAPIAPPAGSSAAPAAKPAPPAAAAAPVISGPAKGAAVKAKKASGSADASSAPRR